MTLMVNIKAVSLQPLPLLERAKAMIPSWKTWMTLPSWPTGPTAATLQISQEESIWRREPEINGEQRRHGSSPLTRSHGAPLPRDTAGALAPAEKPNLAAAASVPCRRHIPGRGVLFRATCCESAGRSPPATGRRDDSLSGSAWVPPTPAPTTG